jgi:hypothetical protein
MASPWFVHQLRWSVFSNAVIAPSETFWKAVTGRDEAENRATVPGGKQYSGKAFHGHLTLQFAGNRLDAILAADPNNLAANGLPVMPSDWSEVVEAFNDGATKLIELLQVPIQRVALGGTVIQRTNTIEEGFALAETLTKSLKFKQPRGRDLIFRINWPVQSKVVEGLSINRITAFSLGSYAPIILQIGDLAPTIIPTFDQFTHGLSLEFDHNTSIERRDLIEKSSILPIFRELSGLAAENLELGEVI